MKILDTMLEGVKLIESSVQMDERGEFSRLFRDGELGISFANRAIKQVNRSVTLRVGTIRGIHYQRPPYAEMKIVRCLRGRVFDVAVDIRHDSSTFLSWYGVELSPSNNIALAIPEGCAHGFQVLEENSEMLYLHSAPYTPLAEGGVRFDDPLIGVAWPIAPTEISQKDLAYSYLDNLFTGIRV